MLADSPTETVEEIDVTLTPTQPYLLPDQSTSLTILKETSWKDRVRGGFPQLSNEDMTLDIAPNTVIASGGYLFHLTTPYEYSFGHVRELDMIFTIVDSCKSRVLYEKVEARVIQLQELSGTLEFNCEHARQVSQLQNISGDGKHFVALRVTQMEIYRRHPSPVLGTGMDVFVVTNFGVKKIRLEYMQEETLTIGPETITVESFNFNYDARTVEVKVSTESSVDEAEAVIVEYDNVANDVETSTDSLEGEMRLHSWRFPNRHRLLFQVDVSINVHR
jgi:hypothetical protein